jgi:hypothetical protein
MSFDFQNADAWSVSTDTMLPVGNHLVTIQNPVMSETSTGKPQLELKVENELGAIRDWLVITPNSIGKIVMLYDAAGVERPQEGEFNPENGWLTDAAVDRLHGRKVGVVIREEVDNRDPSKMRRRVMGYTDAHQMASDIPADTTGLPAVPAASASRPADEDDKVPF